jgi:hypothetical protein
MKIPKQVRNDVLDIEDLALTLGRQAFDFPLVFN